MTEIEQARPGSLEDVRYCSRTWRYLAPWGHSLDDCLRPNYWKNCIRELGETTTRGQHAFNRIEIIAEDGTWDAELRVMEICEGFVKLRVLRERRDPDADVPVPTGYTIEFLPNNGWRAQAPDGAVLIEKAPLRKLALDAVQAHHAEAEVEA